MIKSSIFRNTTISIVLVIVCISAVVTFAHKPTASENDKPVQQTQPVDPKIVLHIRRYAESIRIAIIRMGSIVLENPEQIDFSSPDSKDFDIPVFKTKVFHPSGSAVKYEYPDPSILVSKDTNIARWHFVKNKVFPGMGRPDQGDIAAFLPFLKQEVCELINQQVTGVKNIPKINMPWNDIITDDAYPLNVHTMPHNGYMCIESNDTKPVYLYYFVLLER